MGGFAGEEAGRETPRRTSGGALRRFPVGGTRGRPFPGQILPEPDEVRRQGAEGRSQNSGHADQGLGRGAVGGRGWVRGDEPGWVAAEVRVAEPEEVPERASERELAGMNGASVRDRKPRCTPQCEFGLGGAVATGQAGPAGRGGKGDTIQIPTRVKRQTADGPACFRLTCRADSRKRSPCQFDGVFQARRLAGRICLPARDDGGRWSGREAERRRGDGTTSDVRCVRPDVRTRAGAARIGQQRVREGRVS
jgi:hypothetical protein